MDFANILSQFQTQATLLSAQPYGSGHINDTYLVKTAEGTQPDYILQRVNHRIFKNVPALMDNILRVTEHLRRKLGQVSGANPDEQSLTVILTKSDLPYYQDTEGNYWRLYLFIAQGKSYDLVTSAEMAYEGGKAFGQFQRLLADIPGKPLFETIPSFHHLGLRLQTLEKAYQDDIAGRAKQVRAQMQFVAQFADEMQEVLRLGEAGKIPLRVTHNDTKFNNVLLDENQKALCVIDLDTVMPGYIHYDYSDSIRTVTNTALEDEPDLSKVSVNMDLFRGYTEGFLEQVGSTLTEAEWQTLPKNAKLLPFIIGVRFLTDYLAGDTYFKIKFPEHNLQRTKVQFKLVQSLHACQSEINRLFQKMASCRMSMMPVN